MFKYFKIKFKEPSIEFEDNPRKNIRCVESLKMLNMVMNNEIYWDM